VLANSPVEENHFMPVPEGEPERFRVTDREYLRTQQYRDASNLNARIGLHDRFSTNSRGWHPWVFDQLDLAPDARVLELGCGPGTLWAENSDRIPLGWELILTDLSPGMIGESRRALSGRKCGLSFVVADAQAVPFAPASFDAVIANHMLYHVPDRAQALSEIRRVLRPGGRLYATTVGIDHMRELHDRFRQIAPHLTPEVDRWGDPFNLENGREQLAPWFPSVTLHRYDDALRVTEVEPLIAYLRSGRHQSVLIGNRLAELIRSVEQEIAESGAIRITKASGMFIAS
jgi:ubiquinone/menaquinone biosynthesis C-methylase UbiE